MKKTIFTVFTIFFFLFFIAGCNKEDKKVDIKFIEENIVLEVGEQITIVPEVTVGKKVKNFELTYSVDGDSITVNNNGDVSAVKPGTSVLTATGNDKKKTFATITIVVNEYNLEFTLNSDGNGYIVSKILNKEVTKIVIPNTYKSLPVVEIGEKTISSCVNLVSLIIPKNVKNIGTTNFNLTPSLENIYYGGSLEDWCDITFICETSNPMYSAENFYIKNENGKYKIQEDIVIPDTITSIGNYQFYGFNNLTQVTIGENVTDIGILAFYGCNSITSLVIHDNVKNIGYRAFGNCRNLEKLTLPFCISLSDYFEPSMIKEIIITGGDSIIDNAFSDCSNLINVTLPNTITNIGTDAFKNCNKLEKMTIPFVGSAKENAKSDYFAYLFGGYAYYDDACVPSSLKEVVITGGNCIAENAFFECSNIKSIIISKDTTDIDTKAFYKCESLTTIIIPEKVKFIGSSAFKECDNLIVLCEAASQPSGWEKNWNSSRPVYFGMKQKTLALINDMQYLLDLKSKEATIIKYSGNESNLDIASEIEVNEITYTVVSIGIMAFFKCSDLKDVTLPNSIMRIESTAFYDCYNLTSINIPASVVSVGEKAFIYCISLTIYCEVLSKPSNWSNDWNYSYCQVVWGHTT